jgi:hypothetical protein
VPVTRLGLLLAVVGLTACGGQPAGAGQDAAADRPPRDLGAADGVVDAGPEADAGVDAERDGAGDAAAADASDGGAGDGAGHAADAGDAAQPDAQHDAAPQQDAQHDTAPQQDAGTWHVDIYISNTCQVTLVPTSITVAAGSNLMLDFHNNSQWYNADIWWSWTGGYLDLATGAIWHDPIPACSMTSVHDEYADISIGGGPTSGCPGFRLWVHCV